MASHQIPAVGYETLEWASAESGFGIAGREAARRHAGPYRAAIPADVGQLVLALPKGVQAEAEKTYAHVVRFDAEFGDDMALVASALLHAEAAASSAVDGLVAPARAVAGAELLGDGRPDTAARVARTTNAVRAALVLADDVDEGAILAVHAALAGAEDRTRAGGWRTAQVWIGGGTFGPHGAHFVPPHHGRIGPAIADLMTFGRRDDVPALAQIAVAHAQFETIRPFVTGNGRTGRALIQAMLRNRGLTGRTVLPISAGLLANTGPYLEALDDYRAGDVVPIVRQFSAASVLGVASGRRLIGELRAIRRGWDSQLTARRDSAVHGVADLLIGQPVFDAHVLQRALGIRTGNAHRYVRPLVTAGIIVEVGDRRRNRVWCAPEVLDALDAFAAHL